MKKPKAAKLPRKDCRRDFVTDALGSVAAGFMMAGAMGRLNENLGRSLTFRRSLFTFSILESGRIRIDGQWIEKLRKRFHEGEEFGIKLVSRLLGPALPVAFPQTRVDYWRDGSVSVNREYDYRSRFLNFACCRVCGRVKIPDTEGGLYQMPDGKSWICGTCDKEMQVEPFQTIPPRPPGDSPSVINRRWGERRFCICSQKKDNPLNALFCQHCGGSLLPSEPERKPS